MANYGFKITKAGKGITSTTIDDYVFWSKYPSLVVLERKTATLTIGSSNFMGTHDISHSYNFFPLVLGYVSKASGDPTDYNGQRYLMPASQFAGISCDIFYEQQITFNYKVMSDKVRIDYEVSCIPWGGGTPEVPTAAASFLIELYFFMWRLGS